MRYRTPLRFIKWQQIETPRPSRIPPGSSLVSSFSTMGDGGEKVWWVMVVVAWSTFGLAPLRVQNICNFAPKFPIFQIRVSTGMTSLTNFTWTTTSTVFRDSLLTLPIYGFSFRWLQLPKKIAGKTGKYLRSERSRGWVVSRKTPIQRMDLWRLWTRRWSLQIQSHQRSLELTKG